MGVKDSALLTPVLPPSSNSNSEAEQRDVIEPNNEMEQKAADSRFIFDIIIFFLKAFTSLLNAIKFQSCKFWPFSKIMLKVKS